MPIGNSNPNKDTFAKWWENKGYFLAKEKGILDAPVEIARLAYETGLYESPIMLDGKTLFDFKSHFIKCTCSGHMLEAEVFDYKNGDVGVNFSIWERSRDGKQITSWKEKFRWCWHILKTGCPWADDIIATNKEARGLAEFLLQNLPKEETNEETKQ